MSGETKIKLRIVDHLPALPTEPRSLAIVERLKQVQHYGKVALEFDLSRQRVHQIGWRYGFRLYRVTRWQEAAEKLAPYIERLQHPQPCLHCGNERPRGKRGPFCSACVSHFREIGRVRYLLKKFQETPGRNRYFATQALSLIKQLGLRPEEI